MNKLYATVSDRSPIGALTGKFITTRIYSDGSAEMVINRPPVNALGAEVFDEIGAHALLLKERADVKVVTFTSVSQRGTFIGGADVDMFFTFTKPEDGQEASARYQAILQEAFRDMGKPVIVGVNGVAVGGGNELALFAHEIIAAESAKFGQPELGLHLIPGAGGTQHIPRRAGAAAAVAIIIADACKGPNAYLNAFTAKASGLVDEVVEDSQLDDALRQRARELVIMSDEDRAIWVKTHQARLEGQPPDAEFGLQNLERVDVAKLVPPALVQAAQNALTAIKAAYTITDFSLALGVEAKLFGQLACTQTTKDAVHGLRRLPKPPRVVLPDELRFTGDVTLPDRIVVLGAGGNMGSGIAHNANYRGGFPILGLEEREDLAAAARTRIGGIYDAFYVGKGKMTRADAEARLAQVQTTHDFDQIREGDFVIEAIIEDVERKRAIAAVVHERGGFLITNTSGLKPDDFDADLAIHYFNPPGGMKIVEVVPTQRTTPELLARALAFLKKIQKNPIFLHKFCAGFLVNRIFMHLSNEAYWAIAEGNRIEDVDGPLFLFGFPEGAIAGMDRFGNDIGAHTAENLRESYPHVEPSPLWSFLVENGRTGTKAGKGVYATQTPKGPDSRSGLAPEVQAFVDGSRHRRARPSFSVYRPIFLMVNEAARLIGDGILGDDIAAAAHTIDHALTFGIALPGYTGGLLRYADRTGLRSVVEELERLGDELGSRRFEPAPLLRELAESGRGFHTAG